MSAGELWLTLFVAVIVFGPSRLPMLASHLGKLMRWISGYKKQAEIFWQEQINQSQLEENTRKADKADLLYSEDQKAPEVDSEL